MTIGKVHITQGPTKATITIDGVRLPHVRSCRVDSQVGVAPTVTVTFLATAEITQQPAEPHTSQTTRTLIFGHDLMHANGYALAHATRNPLLVTSPESLQGRRTKDWPRIILPGFFGRPDAWEILDTLRITDTR